MTKLRTGRTLPILGLLGLLGVAAGFALARAAGMDAPPGLRWAVLAATLVSAVWLTLIYWRRIDEAAREAQKSAWFWGSGAGALVGFAGVTSLASRDSTMGGWLPPGASAEALVQAGAMGVLACQIVGFFIAWAIWWWSKR
jgi:hypothetical protein